MPNAARPVHIALCLTLVLAQVLTACASPASPTATPTAAATPQPTLPPPDPTAGPTSTPTPRAATRLGLTALAADVTQFGRAEFAIDTDGVYANPFDPAQADLSVRFDGPGGRAVNGLRCQRDTVRRLRGKAGAGIALRHRQPARRCANGRHDHAAPIGKPLKLSQVFEDHG